MKNVKDLKLNILLQVVFMLIIVSFLSLWAAVGMSPEKITYVSKPAPSVYIPPSTISPASPIAPQVKYQSGDIEQSAPTYSFPQIDIFQAGLSLFIVLLLIFLFLEIFKGKFLFEAVFFIAMTFGAQGFIEVSLSKIHALLISFCLVILRFAYPRIWTHNFIIMIGAAGISAVIGSAIDFFIVLSVLVLISVYEIIIVRKIRYTDKFFKKVSKKGNVFALIIPGSFYLWFSKFGIINSKNKDKCVFFGIGHLILISLLSVSVLPFGVEFSVTVVLGAIAGAVFNHAMFVAQKEKKPFPMLPAMTFFAILGYLIVFAIA